MTDKFEEKLSIRNFFSIAKFDWDINNLNILIGPSGSGKSVCLKLVFFFEKIPSLLKHSNMEPKEISVLLNKEFKDIFCINNFNVCSFNADTKLIYILRKKAHGNKRNDFKPKREDIFNLTAEWKDNQLVWSLNIDLKDINHTTIINRMKEKSSNRNGSFFPLDPVFIPACRSIASVKPLEDCKEVKFINEDYFLKKFLKYKTIFLESLKDINLNKKFKELKNILDITELKYKNKTLTFKDKCGIEKQLNRLASGQAENLYLLPLILNVNIYKKPLTSLFIEEPCAHLFPGNQLNVIKFLVKKLNEIREENQESAFFISTHSPYIIDMINQMIENYRIKKTGNLFNENDISVYEILKRGNRFNVTKNKITKNGFFCIKTWEEVVEEIRKS